MGDYSGFVAGISDRGPSWGDGAWPGQQLFYRKPLPSKYIKVTFGTWRVVTLYVELWGPSIQHLALASNMVCLGLYEIRRNLKGWKRTYVRKTNILFMSSNVRFRCLPNSLCDSLSVTAVWEAAIAWSALMRKCSVSVPMSQMSSSPLSLVSNSKHIGDNKIWPRVHFSTLQMTLANERSVSRMNMLPSLSPPL